MKKITLIFLLFSLSTLLFSGFGCKEEKEEIKTEKNCGCEATLIDFTIPEDEPMVGVISFVEEVGDDETGEFSFKYRIVRTVKEEGNARFFFTICNDELIPLLLRREDAKDSVYFSGRVTPVCQSLFSIPEDTKNHIILTKLEKK